MGFEVWDPKVRRDGGADQYKAQEKMPEAKRPIYPPITINGAAVPYVREYLYLGIMMNDKLCRRFMLTACVARGRKVLAQIAPVVSSKRMPLAIRRQAITGLLLPALAFGGEVLGFQTFNARGDGYDQLESILNKALVMLV